MTTINGLNNIPAGMSGAVPSVPNTSPVENMEVEPQRTASANTPNNAEIVQKDFKENSENNNNVDVKKIADSVDKANKLVLIFDKSIKFSFNAKAGKNYVDIVDNNTNEVIRKIPSEEMRRFLDSVESAVGMIVDQKA